MRQVRVGELWSSRDPAMAARAGTWFSLAGGASAGLLSLLAARTGRLTDGGLATLLVAAVLLLLGGLGRWAPSSVPSVCWALLPGVGAVAVVALNLSTSDASAGAQAFLVWPVLYASYLLRPQGAALVTGLVSVGEVLVVAEASASPVSDGVGLIITFTVMSLVIVRLRDRLDASVAALAEQALLDPLTGLLNRRGFDGRLPATLETADRTPVSLLAVDRDNLKDINDRGGHAAGDRALCRLAAALGGSVRGGDLVFRLGGDEFCIVLRDCTSDAALVRAAEIRALLRVTADGPLTVSVGIATSPQHGLTPEVLLASADRALYQAKHSGRDQAALCSDAVPAQKVQAAASR